ncbi:MAG: transcriptional repressor [Verrucomicrobiota bacterium JB022]|nr:transcriptional repressor [Verrucomicrobiota bacterium JB022]
MQQRDTRQRAAIKQAFLQAQRPLGPKEVLEIASADVPKLGIATVYRNIKSLVEQNELQVVDIPGGTPRYQLPQAQRAHLFICEATDRVYTLSVPADRLSPELPVGFTLREAQLICYGRGPDAELA